MAPSRTIPAWAPIALLALLVIVFYWTPLTSSSASIQWDAADMHYPLQRYFAEHALRGDIPFWTPYLFSGFPFLANPEAAAWYVPHWPLFLAGVTPRSIQLELALHAFLACLGTYLLLLALKLRRSAALTGALLYAFSGFFAGHSSHVGLFCAAAWFPWLLLAYRRAADGAALRWMALGGIAGGMMVLAGYFQTAMYGFLGLGLYAVADLSTAGGRFLPRGQREPVAKNDHRRYLMLRTGGIVAGMLAAAIAMGAIQILPGLELTANSIRANEEYSHATEGVLHWRPLATLVAPDTLGALSGDYRGPADVTQYYFYAGVLLLPLAVLGAVKSRLRLPALLVAVPAAWYLFGPAGGFYRVGALLPGMHKVRAPIQGWFVVALGLAMLAAAGAGWILERFPKPWLAAALVVLVFIDVWYWNSARNPLAYARGSFTELYGSGEELARERVAAKQPPLSRFDAPRHVVALGPLDHPLDLNLEATYGYFSLEPRVYDEYIEAMARNPKLRDGLNVGRVLNGRTGSLDPNPGVLPRAYFPKSVRTVNSEAESLKALETLDPAAQSTVLAPAPAVRQDPAASASAVASGEQSCRVRYHAASPSLLKFAMAWYPGWRAAIGSSEAPVLRVDHALMGVMVPAGDGEVSFRFRSNYFGLGLAITLASALGLGLLAWRGNG